MGPLLAQSLDAAQHVGHQVFGALVEQSVVVQSGYVGQSQRKVHVKQVFVFVGLAHQRVQQIDDTSVQTWIVLHKLAEHMLEDVGRVGVGVHRVDVVQVEAVKREAGGRDGRRVFCGVGVAVDQLGVAVEFARPNAPDQLKTLLDHVLDERVGVDVLVVAVEAHEQWEQLLKLVKVKQFVQEHAKFSDFLLVTGRVEESERA
ncbi:hypothetical protein BpHYR1_032814 [Brachionus plicatilis]|uniref:Uncharacterized protein n=1 Tax=Brachionus plicatilis TaxID=10195 RepID=A0A3M7SH24_BRAPC|nr:hypothetical protein BpHYR1_032814 [Brachionus plicatilis]